MRVVLLNAPCSRNLATPTSTSSAMERKPPLGLLYLATHLDRQARHEVFLLDAENLGWDIETTVDKVSELSPGALGMTLFPTNVYQVHEITTGLRGRLPRLHVCLGGPHAANYPRQLLRTHAADSVVMGDGEEPFSALLDALAEGAAPKDVAGLYTLENLPPDDAAPEPFYAEDCESRPLPNPDLLPLDLYRDFLDGRRLFTLVTTLGCPFKCTFCNPGRSLFQRKSIDRTLAEIERLLQAGIGKIEIYDETFNINQERVAELCEGILSRGWRLQWTFRGRASAVSAEMLKLAARAGCSRIHYGVESGSERILEILGKKLALEQVVGCFRQTREAGIASVAYFMIGNPWETEDEVLQTVRFARRIKPTFATFYVFVPLPGTELFKRLSAEGYLQSDPFLEQVLRPSPQMSFPNWNVWIEHSRLIELQRYATRSFYLRPSQAWRIAARKTFLLNMPRYGRAALSVLRDGFGGRSAGPLIVPPGANHSVKRVPEGKKGK